MRLRLFRGRNWWPRRKRGRRAATGGAAARSRDAQAQQTRAISQSAGPESSRPPRAVGQPGSHRKVPASGGTSWPASSPRASQAPASQPPPPMARHVSSTAAASRDSTSRTAARAAIRTAPGTPGPAPVAGLASSANGAASTASARRAAPAQRTTSAHREASARARAKSDEAQPWYTIARPTQPDAGLRHCGCLEEVLIREWEAAAGPAPECVTAVNRLADLPQLIKEKLAAGLDGIHIGNGGVPDLDDMGGLSGVLLPSGRATWDACAGAYGDRKIIVGSRPSPTPDVMCHEVGHALDDLDGPDGGWQSDGPDFRALYAACQPHLASEFHRHGGSLGRREFFADAFAAIASRQRPALVEMLRGDTRTALDVMLYFNVRYGL